MYKIWCIKIQSQMRSVAVVKINSLFYSIILLFTPDCVNLFQNETNLVIKKGRL